MHSLFWQCAEYRKIERSEGRRKLIGCGAICDFAGLFHIERYCDAITEIDGYSEKSYGNPGFPLGECITHDVGQTPHRPGVPVVDEQLMCTWLEMRHAGNEGLKTANCGDFA